MLNFKSNPHIQAVVLLLIAMIVLQSSGSLAKVLFDQFQILTVSFMRLLLGGTILALIFKIWQINLKQINWVAIISYGVALAGMNALFYLSIHRLPLAIAVSFEFIGPLSVAMYYAKQKYDLLWVGCAILGLILLFPFDQTSEALDPIGIIFALGAGICWAMYIVFGQKPSGISGQHTVCLGMWIGMLFLMPFALYTGFSWDVIQPQNLFLLILLAILASALPFSLEMVALRNLSPFVFGTLTSLEPAIAALSGFIFLHEQLAWTQCCALIIIIMASMGCTYTTHQAKKMVEQQLKNAK